MYFTENFDDIVEIVENIVEFVDENVEDRNIIDVNEDFIASHINSHLTAKPNSPDFSFKIFKVFKILS